MLNVKIPSNAVEEGPIVLTRKAFKRDFDRTDIVLGIVRQLMPLTLDELASKFIAFDCFSCRPNTTKSV